MGWHGDPAKLRRDDLSADWGLGLYGHWRNAGAYLVCDREVGEWLCLSCDVVSTSAPPGARCDAAGKEAQVEIAPRDAFRRRVYLQPLGLLVTVDGGAFERVSLAVGVAAGGEAVLRLSPLPASSTHALLTLTADGPRGGGGGRRVHCRCVARSCSLGAAPFPSRGGAAGEAGGSLQDSPFELSFAPGGKLSEPPLARVALAVEAAGEAEGVRLK